jgi:hypothetical protein
MRGEEQTESLRPMTYEIEYSGAPCKDKQHFDGN